MKSSIVLKLSAVSGSLLLAAAFVSYRAGAIGWLAPSRTTQTGIPVAPENVHLDETGLNVQRVRLDEGRREQLMYSSKSGAVFIEPQQASPESAPAPADPTVDTPVLFSGSKSLQMLPATPAPGNTTKSASP